MPAKRKTPKKSFSLVCWILNKSCAFLINIGKNDTVFDLKIAIKKDNENTFARIDAKALSLWKLSDAELLEPEDTFGERISSRGDLKTFAKELTSSQKMSAVFPKNPVEDQVHIMVQYPSTMFSGFRQSAHPPLSDDHLIAKLRELHKHLWGKNQIVDRTEMACQILNLEPFHVLGLNLRRDKILLIRNDYVSAYDYIRTETLTVPTRRTATLVTGQPGIGKTLFLFYVLARRLHEQGSVAFQINANIYCFFDQHGVTLKSTTDTNVPAGTWALSDTESGDPDGVCFAFKRPQFHVIHTSSPSSPHWKSWVKTLGADMYIMDVWGLEEFRTLLALKSLDFAEGKSLFEKYGPNPRIILDILTNRFKENVYEKQVKTAARHLATEFSTVLLELDDLNFGDKPFYKVITVRRKKTQGPNSYTLEIPTSFLCRTFALAISRLAAAQQHALFNILNSYPELSFSDSAGWLFEDYAHSCLSVSEPNHKPLEAYSLDGFAHHIPVPSKIIAGSTALKHIQPPHNFYWRPLKSNFKGIDAIIRFEDDVWALQYTISNEYKSATDGLLEIRNGMNDKTNVKWHLVMVGLELRSAMKARDNQKLGNEWKWATIVYASQLPMGRFDEQHVKDLDTILNEANDTDQRAELMDELL